MATVMYAIARFLSESESSGVDSVTSDSGPNTFGVDVDTECLWLMIIAGLAMFYMAWGIGANDSANNFGTSFGSGALSFRACCCIAAVCEFSGAVLLGGNVTKTFRKGIADIKQYGGNDGRVLVLVGMTSVLFSAASWLLVSSRFGLPVSTTHSAVGGVVAFAIITKGYDSVLWWPSTGKFGGVGGIVLSWVTSPVLSLLVAFCVFSLIKKYILEHANSFDRTVRTAPLITFVTAFVISLFIFYKGGKGVLDDLFSYSYASASGGRTVSVYVRGFAGAVCMWKSNVVACSLGLFSYFRAISTGSSLKRFRTNAQVGLNETDLGTSIGISAGIAALVGLVSLPIANLIKQRIEEVEKAEYLAAQDQAVGNVVDGLQRAKKPAFEGNFSLQILPGKRLFG